MLARAVNKRRRFRKNFVNFFDRLGQYAKMTVFVTSECELCVFHPVYYCIRNITQMAKWL
jgi:hypothetical protein